MLADPPPLPAGPAEGVARRVAFDHVGWSFYQTLLAAVGDGAQRITYDRGRLEVEVPSRDHGRLKGVVRRLVETYAEVRQINLYSIASTTLGRLDIDGGLEADEAWYVAANAGRAAGDASIADPPDLAVEIDLTSPSVAKEPVYTRLAVPEVWRWRRGQLSCFRLSAEGDAYRLAAASTVLAGFPFDVATDLCRRADRALEATLVAEFRERLRAEE